MTVEEYVELLKRDLARHFAPGGLYAGEAGAMRLAREVGHALADFPLDNVERTLGSLYSDLLVRFTFGHGPGVPVSAKPWLDELRKTMASERRKRECPG